MAHGLQCLCDGRACCPVRALQLVICVFLRFHRHRHPVVSTHCFTGNCTGWCENSTRWKSCKQVRARGGGAWACLAHALQCLCDGRACYPARVMKTCYRYENSTRWIRSLDQKFCCRKLRGVSETQIGAEDTHTHLYTYIT